jgi:hypothetical protein
MKTLLIALCFGGLLTACAKPADVASQNLSEAADNFEVERKITFYNGITGTSLLVIEGYCSLGNYDKSRELTVTCKTGANKYKKNFLGLSDNVTYIAEQIESATTTPFHYRVTFNPSALLPNITGVSN